MTARIHWARIAWTIAAVGSFGTAEAQISVHPQTTPARTVTTVAVPPAGILTVPFTRTPAPPPTETFNVPLKPSPPETIKIALGLGGSISAHRETYSRYQNQGAKVEVRGPCYSACTLIVAHIDMDHICVGEGAFLAFHAAQTTMDVQTAQRHQYATNLMYATYPVPIRAWIGLITRLISLSFFEIMVSSSCFVINRQRTARRVDARANSRCERLSVKSRAKLRGC